MKDERFELALRGADPMEALRQLALDFAASGLRRRQIYELFLDVHRQLQASNDENKEAIMGDVMDMIMQSYPPFNLDIPE